MSGSAYLALFGKIVALATPVTQPIGFLDSYVTSYSILNAVVNGPPPKLPDDGRYSQELIEFAGAWYVQVLVLLWCLLVSFPGAHVLGMRPRIFMPHCAACY